MSTVIVESENPVTLIGGGHLYPDDLAQALELAPLLVAADGGAGAALSQGYVPDAVIGDFDSLTQADRDRIPPDRLFPIREQDSTDFDKALRSVAAPLVLAVGFLGARLDHQLAGFSALIAQQDRACVLLGETELVFHAPRKFDLDLPAGEVVSLFPMLPVQGQSKGLEWPIDGLDLVPGGRLGTSNRTTGPLTLRAEGPGLLVILPRRFLPQLTQRFQTGVAPWPARAE